MDPGGPKTCRSGSPTLIFCIFDNKAVFLDTDSELAGLFVSETVASGFATGFELRF